MSLPECSSGTALQVLFKLSGEEKIRETNVANEAAGKKPFRCFAHALLMFMEPPLEIGSGTDVWLAIPKSEDVDVVHAYSWYLEWSSFALRFASSFGGLSLRNESVCMAGGQP